MNKQMDGVFGGGAAGVGGGTTNAGGGMLLSSMDRMFGCGSGGRALGPPGFLTKTFSLVDDPNTNSIVSWSLSGNSFIIWDHLRFSAEILPRFFKHSNLASFVYQLNSYGFRKIGVEHQWEYENPNFQAGQAYLLANVRRRVPKRRPDDDKMIRDNVNINNGMEEILRNKMDEYKLEIEKLKNKQAEMELRIMALEIEVKKMESKSKKLTIFWAKACNEIIMRSQENGRTEEEDDDDEARKKRRLITHEDQEKEEIVKEDATPLAENQQSVSSTDGCESQIQVEDNNANPEAKLNSGDDHFWDGIPEDDEACEPSEAPTEMTKEATLDLEGLIAEMENYHEAPVTVTL